MSRKKRKRAAHYCWACGCSKSNESFSGKGHARHVCRDCQKLGKKELEYRQAQRDLERCITWEGIIPRKRRKQLERYLESEDPRIRVLVIAMQRQDLQARRIERDQYELITLLDDLRCELQEDWVALLVDPEQLMEWGYPDPRGPFPDFSEAVELPDELLEEGFW